MITIQIKKNIVHTICVIFFVPELKINLLSISQLQEKGYEFYIKNRVHRIEDDKLGFISKVNMTKNHLLSQYL